MQNKLLEIEQNTSEYFDKMKEEGAALEKQLQIYQ